MLGLYVLRYHTFGDPPPQGWSDGSVVAYFNATFRQPKIKRITYNGGKVGYKVDFKPNETLFEIYLRKSFTIAAIYDELDHLKCSLIYDTALDVFKNELEAIFDCPDEAKRKFDLAGDRLKEAELACKKCNASLDAPGGPHGH